MNDVNRFEKILFKVLEDLTPFLPSLVLIGGWVPFLYRNYLWKLETMDPAFTTDIDFGIPASGGNPVQKTIYSELIRLNYLEKHLRMGHLFPVAFHLATSKKYESVPIEFITGKKTSKATLETFLGGEVHIHRVDHFDLLVKDPVSIQMDIGKRNVMAHIPRPERYVMHKLLIYPERNNREKAGKDAFSAYFVLRFHPEQKKLLADIKKLSLEKPTSTVKQILSDFFNTPLSSGILQVEKEIGLQVSLSNLRQDIFERFEMLRSCL